MNGEWDGLWGQTSLIGASLEGKWVWNSELKRGKIQYLPLLLEGQVVAY
jgi:hypothetical protein